jgi:cytochrome c551
MLAVLGFVAFWVILGGGLFFIAARGGIGPARETLHVQTRSGRRFVNVVLVAVYIGFGVIVPAMILVGNANNSSAQVGGVKLTSAEKQGRELFGEHCAVCHTLAAANAVGKVGPNLDTLKPPSELILHTLEYGCLADPLSSSSPETCLGNGTMPADIVEGRQAQQVAAFVARVAGRE